MLCDCAAESTFIYCIDNYVKPFQEIATSYEKLHAENQVMREALEKEIELYGICHEVDCQQYNGTVRPNKRLLCTCKVRRLQEALSQLSSAKSE